jgi:predicted AAA+ superfamily ATPase
MRRYLSDQIERDLVKKMVFVAGPRQVGKTTAVRALPGGEAAYLNWDVAADRERILRSEFPPGDLWLFDELHKYAGWRDMLKGLWDRRRGAQRILVTGSARLDFYHHTGDSLQGRYHLLRMHPLSARELGLSSAKELADLAELGGFPEPWFGGSVTEARRWSREYRQLLLNEEVRALERIRDLGHLEQLVLRMSDLVGSPLSINALREDLGVAHDTVANWIDILERVYALFRIAPLGGPNVRALKKSRKHYHFDWTLVREPGLRFENLIACHLLKWVHWQQDTAGRDLELRYARDKDGREVDFVVTEHGEPILLVEAKLGDAEIGRGLKHLHALHPEAAAWQVSLEGTRDYQTATGLRVAPALPLLADLV